MYDLCCIGHITSDKIVTPAGVSYLPGGTAFYFSSALSRLNCSYLLVTAVAQPEMRYVRMLEEKGCNVLCLPSAHTVCFENIYPENQDQRIQRVTQKADGFSSQQINAVNAQVFHLGPLLADDIPVEMIIALSKRARVSLDVQGYLRALQHENVIAIDWADKKKALAHIHFLKANEQEAAVLTGKDDLFESARLLAEWGIREVIITMGSKGSLLFCEDRFYEIPAYPPKQVMDATGCGDTYMAGYLYQRSIGKDCAEAAHFAAAMATIKIENAGPFHDDAAAVYHIIQQASFK